MKRTPSIKPETAVCIYKSDSHRHRRGFSGWLILSLSLLVSLHLLSGSFLYGQENDDALFVDRNGNVTVAETLDVKKDISARGAVQAKKFEGDGSALTLEGVAFVKQVKGRAPITLAEIVRAVIADMVPIGTIMAYGGDVNNDGIKKGLENQGWLACNGQQVPCDAYRELFDAIRNVYRDGHATTVEEACSETFQLPDIRGRFLRGVNYDAADKDGAPRDPECKAQKNCDKVGAVQEDAFKNHSHVYRTNTWFWSEGKTGGHYIRGNHTTDFLHHDRTGAEGNSAETRPKNIHVNWIIKARHIIR